MLGLPLLLALIYIASSNSGKRAVYTQVTYLYDLKTDTKIASLSNAEKMLKQQQNLIIFGPKELEFSIMERRKQYNTVFIPKQLQAFTKSWYSSYVQKQQPKDANSVSSKYDELIKIAKILLLAQALQKDKFNSDFFIWVDVEFLYQNPQTVSLPSSLIRSFYQWIQPQWLFFTKYRQQQVYLNYSQGEERFINRRLMFHQVAVPTFMGGYTEIVTDIKNAYESLLRIVLQTKGAVSVQNSLSLMPLLFPALVPNTVSIGLPDLYEKIHIYERANRLPKRKTRFFNAFLESSDKIIINEHNKVTKYTFQFNQTQLRDESQDLIAPLGFIDLVKFEANYKQQLIQNLDSFISGKQFFKKKAIYIEALILLILVAVYIKLIVQNIKNKKNSEKALENKKPKDACYIKLAHRPNQSNSF